jgi:hypothetical protein
MKKLELSVNGEGTPVKNVGELKQLIENISNDTPIGHVLNETIVRQLFLFAQEKENNLKLIVSNNQSEHILDILAC